MVEEVCQLKARVVHDPPNHFIEVFVVGKWRPVRYYGGRGYVVKNKDVLYEIERTVRINTGSHTDCKLDLSKGTFAGKKIVFVWQEPISDV